MDHILLKAKFQQSESRRTICFGVIWKVRSIRTITSIVLLSLHGREIQCQSFLKDMDNHLFTTKEKLLDFISNKTMFPRSKIYDNPKRRPKIEQHMDLDVDVPDGDPIKGEQLFRDYCSMCHHLDITGTLGPKLRDIYERKVASRKGFFFSSSIIAARGVYWTRRMLYQFLEDPEAMFPETEMTFDGIQDPYERACIVEYLCYLRTQTLLKKE